MKTRKAEDITKSLMICVNWNNTSIWHNLSLLFDVISLLSRSKPRQIGDGGDALNFYPLII